MGPTLPGVRADFVTARARACRAGHGSPGNVFVRAIEALYDCTCAGHLGANVPAVPASFFFVQLKGNMFIFAG